LKRLGSCAAGTQPEPNEAPTSSRPPAPARLSLSPRARP
jgi:hypothetical protein